MKKGKLIVIEGVDGAGKTSTSLALREWLLSENYSVKYFPNPLKEGPAGEIRKLLIGGGFQNPITDYYLSLASFAELQSTVNHALKEVDYIIVDRWTLSAYVYQILNTEFSTKLYQPFYTMETFVNPDFCFYLSAPKTTIMARISRRGEHTDRFEQQLDKSYINYEKAMQEPKFAHYLSINVNNTYASRVALTIRNTIIRLK